MSVQISHSLVNQRRMRLRKAILIYGEERQNNAYRDQPVQRCAATVHNVECVGNRPTIMPGVGVSIGAVEELVKALASTNQDKAERVIMSPNILSISLTHVLWWKPSHVSQIFFSGHKTLSRLSGKFVTHPNLLFLATPQDLSVFALAQERRPMLDTPLFQAPYLNVWENGRICRGTGKYPSIFGPGTIDVFERAFFDTNFTHSNREHLCNHPRGVTEFWRDLVGKRKKKVPVRWLLATNK